MPKSVFNRQLVKDELAERDWSNHRLVQELRVSPTTVHRWLNEDVDPSMQNIALISEILDISIEALFMSEELSPRFNNSSDAPGYTRLKLEDSKSITVPVFAKTSRFNPELPEVEHFLLKKITGLTLVNYAYVYPHHDDMFGISVTRADLPGIFDPNFLIIDPLKSMRLNRPKTLGVIITKEGEWNIGRVLHKEDEYVFIPANSSKDPAIFKQADLLLFNNRPAIWPVIQIQLNRGMPKHHIDQLFN